MIFNTDTTLLSSNVAMAEGYDCSVGTALALIDSARNDGAMFEAMLGIEAQACQLESAGYTNESGEVIALQEAAAGGILNKIAELFKKLAEKIKSIFHTFFSKINSLFMSDKQMVKKYQSDILAKSDVLNKLEVTWRKENTDIPEIKTEMADYKSITWEPDKSDRDKNMYKKLGYDFVEDNVVSDIINHYLADKEKMKLSETENTAKDIVNSLLSDFPAKIKKEQSKANSLIKSIIRESDKCKKDASKYASNTNVNEVDTKELENLNHNYDKAVSYQDCQLKINSAIISILKIQYKQTKAAFMKMISANPNKLKETAIFSDSIAEAAENEVEDVLTAAISKEDLSEVNNASMAVKDADVSDDPDKLVYSDDPEYKEAPTDGTIKSCVAGRCKYKEESAFFGQMLY